MNYEELKKYFNEYILAENEYRKESEKHFPTNCMSAKEPIKFTLITKDEILKIARLRKVRDNKENKWQQAMIEHCNNRK